jgi:hypothetical protein
MDHLIGASRLIRNRAILGKVLESRRKEIEILDKNLNNFIKKFDHRSRESIDDDESSAWIRFYRSLNNG